MLREAFSRIMTEYAEARQQSPADHELARFIRHDLPAICRQRFSAREDLIWHGSPGVGNWASAPWLATFDLSVTDTAQRGYYPVFLFSADLGRVYLSMNQGVTALRDEFGNADALALLPLRAGYLKARVAAEFRANFSEDQIDLSSAGRSPLLRFYEAGHAFGKRYMRDALPGDEELFADLTEMLRLYHLIVARGGTDDPETDSSELDSVGAAPDASSLLERRRFSQHRRLEGRNQRLVKRVKELHGLTCKVCDFNFAESYGELGRGYVEAHHLIPWSQLPLDEPVPLSPETDFTVLCANCHRMIDRRGAPKTVAELRQLVESFRANK